MNKIKSWNISIKKRSGALITGPFFVTRYQLNCLSISSFGSGAFVVNGIDPTSFTAAARSCRL